MSEKPPSAPNIRRDLVSGVRSIIAEDRSLRPLDTIDSNADPNCGVSLNSDGSSGKCPFCVGAEHETPPAIATYPVIDGVIQPNGGSHLGDWSIRVVPNRYPAVNLEVDSDTSPASDSHMLIYGRHEVIIESREHISCLTQATEDHSRRVITTYRDRLQDCSTDERIRSAILFKNHGAAAGASLQHIHSQLIGLPHVPEKIQQELDGWAHYERTHHRCVFCDLIDQAERDDRIVIDESDHVAFCPKASRFGYETWILPRNHRSDFHLETESTLSSIALSLRKLLEKTRATSGCDAYNYVIHTAPFDSQWKDHYHWHIEITPRNATLAGFEIGSGCYISTISPENAAFQLRNGA